MSVRKRYGAIKSTVITSNLSPTGSQKFPGIQERYGVGLVKVMRGCICPVKFHGHDWREPEQDNMMEEICG